MLTGRADCMCTRLAIWLPALSGLGSAEVPALLEIVGAVSAAGVLWALWSGRARGIFAVAYAHRFGRETKGWWASPFFWVPLGLFALCAFQRLAGAH